MSSAQEGGGTGLVPTGPTAEPPAVSVRLRGLVVAVCTLLLAHFVATFLWAAPGYLTGRADDDSGSGAPATGAQRALEAYMTPVFAQSWSIFAPSPLHVEYTLRVRGVYAAGPDGSPVPGPWSDTTAVEARALTGHLLPAATERPSRRLASDARAAYLALPQEARAAALRPPQHTRVPEPADADPWPTLRSELLAAGTAPDVVDDYLATDRTLAAYATQVLRAGGGAGAGESDLAPVYVQASIVRQGVAPYGNRERPEPTTLTLGARPPLVLGGQDDAAFHRTWDALRNRAPARGGAG